jgi:hypothetical protein
MKSDPEQVASKLNVQISSETVDAVLQGAKLQGAATRFNEVTITTITVATIVLAVPDGDIVIDYSKHVTLKA